MNYILKYYYDIEKEATYNKNGNIYIRSKMQDYIIKEIEDEYYIECISELIERNNIKSKFYEIVKTKYNKNYVENQNKKYVLLKVMNNYSQNILADKIEVRIDNNKYKYINRNNWYFLWSNKNDNIQNIIKKIKIPMNEIFDYFIGMAENAILYYNLSNLDEKKDLYISKKRIDIENNNNPLNIIIDRRERDVAEIIKYQYFNCENYESKLNIFVELSTKENLSLELIFSRILYPTIYFDILESDNKQLLKQKKLLNKLLNYEKFLKQIYKKLSEHKMIKKIDWL